MRYFADRQRQTWAKTLLLFKFVNFKCRTDTAGSVNCLSAHFHKKQIINNKHSPQNNKAARSFGRGDVLLWCHLLLRGNVCLCCALGLPIFPLLCQLLPGATEGSQTAMFDVIGPFGWRTPEERLKGQSLVWWWRNCEFTNRTCTTSSTYWGRKTALDSWVRVQ